MLKKYQAKSHVSISVSLKNGKSAHVQFSSLTQGGSVYYTEDEVLQEALERHPKYGKLFKVIEECSNVENHNQDDFPNIADDAETEYTTAKDSDSAGNDSSACSDHITITVSCVDDAKEYLVDKLGISRTKLRSVKAIKESAEANNVEFVGI